MQIHGRAKLGPAGRLALCEAIESGLTFRAAARGAGVSPATAHRWWRRYQDALPAQRHSLAWTADRSSGQLVRRGCWTPPLRNGSAKHASAPDGGQGSSLAPRATHIQRSGRCCIVTAYRAGQERLVTLPGATSGRALETCCTWILPATRGSSGQDTASRETARSAAASGWSPGKRVGYDFAHAIVDDHSRLAYVELHQDEKAATVTGFVERALDWFIAQGIALSG